MAHQAVSVMHLPPGYTEWAAPAGLRHAIACLWAQVTPDGGDREELVLPDACSDLIWAPGQGAFVAGPDTGPVPTVMTAGTVMVGVRFRPSAGGPALGVPLSELRDRRIDLADLRRRDAARLPGTLDPDIALARALDVAAALVAEGRPDPAVMRAATLLANPRALTGDVAAQIGLSRRQLRRRCHAAVGYGPKTLQRVLRFRRFVSRLDAAPTELGALDLAVLAAQAGYADQAHLTRECRELAGLTPAALARERAPGLSPPAEEVLACQRDDAGGGEGRRGDMDVAAETLLESWNDTPARRAIVDFVRAAGTEDSPGFVPPADRVAVFDNDGTLWSEKPIPIELDFILFRMAELAARDPSLKERQPYKAAAERDYRWLGEAMVKHYHGDDADLELLKGALESAFEGVVVEAFGSEVLAWLGTASHPVLRRPYLSCGFVPMVELLRYLEANGFTTYIASGGDRDFMRPFAHTIYGIPPERVIGSALGLDFDADGDDTRLVYKSTIEFFDDGPQKPVRIWSRIGRRPLVAGGNSNGDIPMMRFARTGERGALRLLVLHDDADREFAYTAGAEDALDRARTHGWTIVSMKDDWATVFAS
jgi:AraC-like DNA-binding protein/phosphoserine phosphatase